jgi:hypothetical protein
MSDWFRLVGLYGLVGVLLYCGYLVFVNNQALGFVMIVIGMIFTGVIIGNDIEYRNRELTERASWGRFKN